MSIVSKIITDKNGFPLKIDDIVELSSHKSTKRFFIITGFNPGEEYPIECREMGHTEQDGLLPEITKFITRSKLGKLLF